MSGLSQPLVAKMWGCHANHIHICSIFSEQNEAEFQHAIIEFRQKESTEQTEKVIRQVYSLFEFDLINLCCRFDCFVCFPRRGRVISVYSSLGSTIFLFDHIKEKISPAS